MISRTALRTLLLVVGLGVGSIGAGAAGIQVAPVTHDLAPGQTMISMTLSNRGETPATLQVRGFEWTQPDGQDRLVPAAPPGREASYRLLIDELPTGAAEGGIRMALRLSIPVFAHGAAPDPSRLAARLDPDRATVTLANEGGSRTRVQALTLTLPNGQRIAAEPIDGPYLLAGAQRRWSLAALPPGSHPISAVALTDLGPVDLPVVKLP